MSSEKFGAERLPGGKAVGKFDFDKTNTLGTTKYPSYMLDYCLHYITLFDGVTIGGSLSIGHPFGATGARLATTAANRLQREVKYLLECTTLLLLA
jgi:acetyl-CoA acetyltransferase